MTPRPLFPTAHHLRIWYFQTQPDGNSRLRCSVPCPCGILKPFLHLKLATTCQKHKEKRALNGRSHPDSQAKTIFILQSVPAHKGSVSNGKTSLNIEQNIPKCSAILSVNKQTFTTVTVANPMLSVAPRSSLAKSFMMSSHRPHSFRLAAWLSCAGSHIVGWERLRMRGLYFGIFNDIFVKPTAEAIFSSECELLLLETICCRKAVWSCKAGSWQEHHLVWCWKMAKRFYEPSSTQTINTCGKNSGIMTFDSVGPSSQSPLASPHRRRSSAGQWSPGHRPVHVQSALPRHGGSRRWSCHKEMSPRWHRDWHVLTRPPGERKAWSGNCGTFTKVC